MRTTPLVVAISLAIGALIGIGDIPAASPSQPQQAVRKVDVGDYEPVVPWPKPLPDTDLSHDGST